MIDFVQRQKELLRSVELLTQQVADLQKYKRELQTVNFNLDRESVIKMNKLRMLTTECLSLQDKLETVKVQMSRLGGKEPES